MTAAACGGDGRSGDDDSRVYVALGDSIARGALLRTVRGGRNRACKHTRVYSLGWFDAPQRAYPQLVARELNLRLTSLACSGLGVQELLAPGSRLLDRAVELDPDVVTVQIGANEIVLPCIGSRAVERLLSSRFRPPRPVKNAIQGYATCPPQRVVAGIAAVARDLPRVLGRLTDETAAEIFVGTYYSATGTAAEDAVARDLNAVIAGVVAEAGPRVHLVDGIFPAFRSHDCRHTRDRWLLGWDLCLHPNARGQQALADRFVAVIEPNL